MIGISSFSTNWLVFLIDLTGPPDPPTNVRAVVEESGNNINANVSWLEGFNNYSPITSFNIESRTQYMPEWKEERNCEYDYINKFVQWMEKFIFSKCAQDSPRSPAGSSRTCCILYICL